MESSLENEISIDDVRREAALDVQKKDVARRIQLIIFKLGTEEFALSIDQIKEVVLTPRIAKMPQTQSYIKGVANIRGSIIAILDLEEKFGIDKLGDLSQTYNYTLVLENETFKAGFLVREVPNTLSILSTDIENATGFIQTSTIDDNYIQGVVKAGDRLIILIDIQRLVEGSNINSIVNKVTK